MSFDPSARRRPTHTREIHSRHKRLARSAASPQPDTAESGPDLSPASPSGGEILNSLRRAAVAAVVLTLAFALASCTSDDKPATKPSATQTSPTTAATTAAPSWKNSYSPKELAAYEAALARYTAYQAKVKPVWAAGKATPAAKALFKEYFIPWQYYFGQLEQYEASNIRLNFEMDVLNSEATRIKLGADGGSVSIRQCVDSTKSSGTQNNDPLPKATKTPQLIDIVVEQAEGRWLIAEISNSTEDRPCDV